MKHTECKDCKYRKGNCGYHFKMDGITNFDIASLSACDKYGDCMFFERDEEDESKGHLISREALKKAIMELPNDNPSYYYTGDLLDRERVLDLIDNVLTVERPTDEWIPVSERMPKEEDYRPCYGFEDGCVMWQTDNGDIGFGWYYDSTKCWSDTYDHPVKTGKVIAWQPLPKSFKKGSAEE